MPLWLLVGLGEAATWNMAEEFFNGAVDASTAGATNSGGVKSGCLAAGASDLGYPVARVVAAGQLPTPASVLVLEFHLAVRFAAVLSPALSCPRSLSRFGAFFCCWVTGSWFNLIRGSPRATGTDSGSGCQFSASGAGAGNASHDNSTTLAAFVLLVLR